MSIFDRLGHQHRDIKELFSDVAQAMSLKQRGMALTLFELGATKLLACIHAEHAVVYPRLADIAELVTDVINARNQHARIESTINQLRIGGLERDVWTKQLDLVIQLIQANFDLKEFSMFPIARLALMPKQLQRIDLEFSAHLAHTMRVAGASITYDPTPRTVREVSHATATIQVFDLGEPNDGLDLGDLGPDEGINLNTDEVIDLELDDIIEMDRNADSLDLH